MRLSYKNNFNHYLLKLINFDLLQKTGLQSDLNKFRLKLTEFSQCLSIKATGP